MTPEEAANLSPLPRVLSNSFLKEAMECPRKAQFSYGFGWQTVATSFYLVAGAEYARAQEARRLSIILGKDEDEQALAGLMAIQEEQRPAVFPAPPGTHTRGGVMLAFLFAFPMFEEEKRMLVGAVQPPEGVQFPSGVEFSFLTPAPGGFTHPEFDEPLLLSGRLDAIEFVHGKLHISFAWARTLTRCLPFLL